MQKGLITKIIFVVVLLILAGISLYPTFQFSGLQQKETAMIAQLVEMTGLSRNEVEEGLLAGDLEARIRRHAGGDVDAAVALGRRLSDLSKKVNSIERRAIKRGLDLQGGIYMVYEADLPKLLRNLAKSPDERLEAIIDATQKTVEERGGDFFAVLEDNFRANGIELNRYFGRRGETNDKVIADLKKEAEDAVDRTLEVLRNRVDQFGVSEPVLTKQGSNRIIIELAGIQSIQRARNIISSTALLEFKLVQPAEMVWAVLDDIDRVMRAKQRAAKGADTTDVEKKATEEAPKAKETEVSLDYLFGQTQEKGTAQQAEEKVVIDENTFSDRPFSALLRQLQNRNFIAVPMQNVYAVQRILQLPEVKAVIPADAEFLFGNAPITLGQEQFQRLYLVKKEPELLGEMLSDASVQVSTGSTSLSAGAPYVSMELNSEGAKIFSKVTGMNVGRELAIVLDGKVASAPVIQTKITTGSAMIEGTFTMEEAKDLALILRAGALPAPLYPITENTVGPSLGQDSIQKGQFSALLGFILVVLYMIFYYRWSGLIADFALLFNVVFILAVMAAFHATLTLPGIAGIILTLGMAVDANVLIFERIREELRSGKTIRAAIDAGYGRAFVTILDANITTLISAVVLYSFGTGPIKGFALTLSIGIVVSMFTAIFVTRLVYDYVTSRFAIKKLSI